MSSFIFVRHGQSQANYDKVLAAPDSPLTDEGRAQAQKAGRELQGKGITRIISSPLLRARETADIIAKEIAYTGEITVIDDLRERGFGQLIDQPKQHPSEWYFTVDGESDVEPRGVLIARCEAALAKIKKLAEPQEKVLVVGHAVSGFYLRQVAGGKRFFDDFDPPKEFANSSLNQISIVDKIPMQRASRESLVGVAAVALGLVCLAIAFWWMSQK
jgi:broad specificity phosphatase PhoE